MSDEHGVVDMEQMDAWVEGMRDELRAVGRLDEAESDAVKRMTDAASQQRELVSISTASVAAQPSNLNLVVQCAVAV